MEREQLIDALASDVEPVGRPPRAAASLLVWLAASWLTVLGVTLALGPLRPGVGGQLVDSLRFALESLLAVAGAGAAMWGAIELSIPHPRALRFRVLPAVALLGVWVSLLVYGLQDPALAPSMAGKRPGCNLQALAFSLPPLALGIFMLRRRSPLRRGATGALVGAAAGALPALIMQFACMYDPAHDLMNHLAPALITVALGALLGWRLLPRV